MMGPLWLRLSATLRLLKPDGLCCFRSTMARSGTGAIGHRGGPCAWGGGCEPCSTLASAALVPAPGVVDASLAT